MELSELVVKKIGDRKWKLNKPYITPYGVVPKGFVVNGANVPRLLWWLFSPAGKLFHASVFHDWCYKTAYRSRLYADFSFYRIALATGVNKFEAKAAYWAVRLFGKGSYK